MSRRLERFSISLDQATCVDRFLIPAIDEDCELVGAVARNGSASGGAAATQTLTSTGAFLDAVKATARLTSTNVFGDSETVTIGTGATLKVYTYKAALTPLEGEILIGANQTASHLNLLNALNHTGTPGTDYSCANAHPTVEGTSSDGTHTVVSARVPGTAGNAIAIAEACANAAWDGAAVFLAGGLEAETVTLGTGATAKTYTYRAVLSIPAVANEVLIGANQTASHLNILRAVNKGAGEGTLYGTGTTAHTTVVADSSDGTHTVFSARVKGTAGNSLASTETCALAGFGAGTFAGGTDMTLMLRSCANGVAVASGTAMLAAEMDLAGTPINSSVVGWPNTTIFNTQLRKGYAIGLDFTGTVTGTVGLSIGVILRRTGPAVYA